MRAGPGGAGRESGRTEPPPPAVVVLYTQSRASQEWREVSAAPPGARGPRRPGARADLRPPASSDGLR